MLSLEETTRLCEIIDSGPWKHSWHLPKDRNGYIDWHSYETRRRAANTAREIINDLLLRANRYSEMLNGIDLSVHGDCPVCECVAILEPKDDTAHCPSCDARWRPSKEITTTSNTGEEE